MGTKLVPAGGEGLVVRPGPPVRSPLGDQLDFHSVRDAVLGELLRVALSEEVQYRLALLGDLHEP